MSAVKTYTDAERQRALEGRHFSRVVDPARPHAEYFFKIVRVRKPRRGKGDGLYTTVSLKKNEAADALLTSFDYTEHTVREAIKCCADALYEYDGPRKFSDVVADRTLALLATGWNTSMDEVERSLCEQSADNSLAWAAQGA